MDHEVKQLILRLLEMKIQTVEKILTMELTVFDRSLVEIEGRPPIGERLARLAWHDKAHVEELIKIKGHMGKPGSMDQEHLYPYWFLREALTARAQLIGELLDLSAEDLDYRTKPTDRSIREIVKHVIDTESGFLVGGIRKSLENRNENDRAGRLTRSESAQQGWYDEEQVEH